MIIPISKRNSSKRTIVLLKACGNREVVVTISFELRIYITSMNGKVDCLMTNLRNRFIGGLFDKTLAMQHFLLSMFYSDDHGRFHVRPPTYQLWLQEVSPVPYMSRSSYNP